MVMMVSICQVIVEGHYISHQVLKRVMECGKQLGHVNLLQIATVGQ